MDKLKICRKDKLIMFLIGLFAVISCLWLYPQACVSVYRFFVLSEEPDLGYRQLLYDLTMLFWGIPNIIIWCYPIKQYISILLDIKFQKLVTVTVRGRKRPEAEVFDRYVPGTKDENDIHFYWKAIDDTKKKYRFFVFKDVNTLKGETTKHYYNVTYYKYSKIVTHIEKAKIKQINNAEKQ